VQPMSEHGFMEGQSLLYIALKRLVLGPIPQGHDVFLNATAMAGWAGLLVTMLNLLPVGQLDGGHIAYALFGKRQDRFAQVLHWGLLVMVVYNLLTHVPGAIMAGQGLGQIISTTLSTSLSWIVWFLLLHLLKRLAGREHPPTDPGELSIGRKVVAVVSLVVFVLLFMPTPMTAY
jgi:membrane-associated protease RseP (regulator of RpoE activity)